MLKTNQETNSQLLQAQPKDRLNTKTFKGTLFVISAASGTGKSSLTHALVARDKRVALSVSHTTRPRRSGEVAGYDYYYVTEQIFQEMVAQHQFLEYAQVFNYYYGTSKVAVEAQLAGGRDVLLEIDWQGAQIIRALMPCVSIFLLPPSLDTLEKRLIERGRDPGPVIAQRLASANEDIAHYHEFDYLIVNQDFERALDELRTIVMSYRLRSTRQAVKYQQLLLDLMHKTV